MPRKRQYRKKRDDSNSSEEEGGGGKSPSSQDETKEEDVMKKVAEAKDIQRFRKRPTGVSAVGLAFGQKFSEAEKLAPDPFHLKSGGLVDMNEMQPSDFETSEDDLLQKLKNTFSAETKLKDDETHMLQYIEREMVQRRGVKEKDEEISNYDAKIKALYQLPDRLKIESSRTKTEEMLSNQMLSGIPEVDLGLEAKFKNIEETEMAKQKLIEEQAMKTSAKKSLVPSNMATNFTLHNLRFYKDKNQQVRKPSPKHSKPTEVAEEAYIPVVGENEPELKLASAAEGHKKKLDHNQLATDDFHFDKYRKKSRRY